MATAYVESAIININFDLKLPINSNPKRDRYIYYNLCRHYSAPSECLENLNVFKRVDQFIGLKDFS